MANFRKHISWGVFLGIAVIVFGLIFSLFSGIEIIFWIFLAVLFGSFLPDLDSDGGLPFQVTFGLAGLILAGTFFYFLFENEERDWKILIGIPVVAFILIRFILGYFFQKLTKHRGIFHSVPASALSGLITVWILGYSSINFDEKILIGLAVFVGYLGHLILDEIYSTVNLKGLSILPKKSLGSAIKFWSFSKKATFIVYFLLALFFNLIFKIF